jgi:hypothetical protein
MPSVAPIRHYVHRPWWNRRPLYFYEVQVRLEDWSTTISVYARSMEEAGNYAKKYVAAQVSSGTVVMRDPYA